MQVTNRRQYPNVDFTEYVKMPGFSYSGLRNPDGFRPPTNKMRFGTLVDDYLFSPHVYTGEQRELVVPVARELQRTLGDGIKFGKPQLSVTADFTHDGLTMPFRGRLDLLIGKVVLDLKVSELSPVKAVEFFRYDWQLSGYCAAVGGTNIILCSIHPKTKKITMMPIKPVYDWWEHQIKINGTPQ